MNFTFRVKFHHSFRDCKSRTNHSIKVTGICRRYKLDNVGSPSHYRDAKGLTVILPRPWLVVRDVSVVDSEKFVDTAESNVKAIANLTKMPIRRSNCGPCALNLSTKVDNITNLGDGGDAKVISNIRSTAFVAAI